MSGGVDGAVPRTLVAVTRQPYSSGRCGSGTYFSDLLRNLAAENFLVELLVLPPEAGRLGILRRGAIAGVREHLPVGIVIGPWVISPILPLIWLFGSLLKRLGRAEWRKGLETWFESRALRRMIAVHEPDGMLANYWWTVEMVSSAALEQLPVAVLTHDVWSHKQADFNREGVPMTGPQLDHADEAAALRLADIVVAISAADAEVFRGMTTSRIVVVQKSAKSRAWEPIGNEPRVLFVGSGYAANVDGLRWFVEEIWPAIRTQIPAAQLDVCGVVGDRVGDLREHAGIYLHGRVPELAPFYRSCRAAILPLRVGSGLKIKLVEAMEYGRGIVTTSVGVQGVDFLPTGAIAVADEPEAFARALVRLLDDPKEAEAAGRLAAAAAAKHFSAAACVAPLIAELVAAKPTSRGGRL